MTTLQEIIIKRIQRGGPITFADYMRMALYEPEHGYYVTGPARMGWGGDYYTSSDVSTLFAHCIGRQLFAMWEQLDHPTPFRVIEQGAGRAKLGQELQGWAQREQADFHEALRYQSEDIKIGYDALRNEQTALPSVLLSNELVDAFPAHVIEVRAQRLYEVYVDMHHGRLHEVLAEPSASQLLSYLEQHRIPWQTFPDGWRAEINLDALQWMRSAAQRLSSPAERGKRKHHGYLLTIDYGEKARNLYTRERRRGTLACYFQHQLTEQPLVRPGEQDITAHVNFSALITEGRAHGLHLNTFTTQREWLEHTGLYEELEQLRSKEFALADKARASDQGQVALLQWYNLRQRAAALTDPYDMGNFKVLIMKR